MLRPTFLPVFLCAVLMSTGTPAQSPPKGDGFEPIPTSAPPGSPPVARAAPPVVTGVPGNVAQPPTGVVPAGGVLLPPLPNLPEVNRSAFEAARGAAFPLSPEQIELLRRADLATERAATQGPAPTPVSSAVVADLSPGAYAPVVRLSEGTVTSLIFVDPAGSPLQITNVAIGGNQAHYAITPPSEAIGMNVLKLSPTLPFVRGSLSVSVQGVSAPVSLTLLTGQREVDFRVDVRVRGGNLGGRVLRQAGGMAEARAVDQFLAGSPSDARLLRSSASNVQVFAWRNRYYVRSMNRLLSPAFLDSTGSADGTLVFEIAPTAAVVMLHGDSPLTVSVEDVRG